MSNRNLTKKEAEEILYHMLTDRRVSLSALDLGIIDEEIIYMGAGVKKDALGISDLITAIKHDKEKKSSQHARTIKIDDAIYKIVKDLDSGEGVPKYFIYKTLTIAPNIQITESQLSNRLWNMCNKRKILVNAKKGFYAIKHNVGVRND